MNLQNVLGHSVHCVMVPSHDSHAHRPSTPALSGVRQPGTFRAAWLVCTRLTARHTKLTLTSCAVRQRGACCMLLVLMSAATAP